MDIAVWFPHVSLYYDGDQLGDGACYNIDIHSSVSFSRLY